MIMQIGFNLFYFYYLDKENSIQEGFFIFGDIENYNKILDIFINNKIDDFVYYYFKNIQPSFHKNNNSKCYNIKEFDLIIKINKNEKEKEIETKNDEKDTDIKKKNNYVSKVKQKIKNKNNNYILDSPQNKDSQIIYSSNIYNSNSCFCNIKYWFNIYFT